MGGATFCSDHNSKREIRGLYHTPHKTMEERCKKNNNRNIEYIDSKSVAGFYTRDYTKPTAIERTFFHGQSHHHPTVFKLIDFGETVTLRQLNEQNETYRENLSKPRNKYARSSFNMNVVDQWFSTFCKRRTSKLSNLLLWTPYKSTQISTIPISRPKSSEEQKKKVITSVDVLFSAQNQSKS